MKQLLDFLSNSNIRFGRIQWFVLFPVSLMKASSYSKIRQSALLFLWFLTMTACQRETFTPWHKDTSQLWRDYRAAVEDARVAEPHEISLTLPAITSSGDNPRMEWCTEKGKQMVLVCSMMSSADALYWQREESFELDDQRPWVTLPYDLGDHLLSTACTDSVECRMRMIQLLGLPPDCLYDTFVFFYADCEQLYRPSFDSEIDDTQVELDFRPGTSDAYRQWFNENADFSYNSSTPYPWTRLGYTYDWHSGSGVVGPGEFVVSPTALVKVWRIVGVWQCYRMLLHEQIFH